MEEPQTRSGRISKKVRTRIKKLSTNKILDRITFNPQLHKHKVKKKLRQDLQKKEITPQLPQAPPSTITFGSLNINGLDLEASWAVEQLLVTKGLDVSKI